MSVRRRKWRDPKTGKRKMCWMIDITYYHSDDDKERIREVSPVQSRNGALAYEQKVLLELVEEEKKEEVTEQKNFEEFSEVFMKRHVLVENKNSEVLSKTSILKNHVVSVHRVVKVLVG